MIIPSQAKSISLTTSQLVPHLFNRCQTGDGDEESGKEGHSDEAMTRLLDSNLPVLLPFLLLVPDGR